MPTEIRPDRAHFFFPVVVVDAQLISCSLANLDRKGIPAVIGAMLISSSPGHDHLEVGT